MIILHRLNGSALCLNEDHIEFMEETPDTVIHLTNERKYVVREKIEEIIDLIAAYRSRIHAGILLERPRD